ncbi:MAG: M15 family metallopeptidase [Eubacteriales bacterium]|nr:M15 family metallopeptidase [Eubacteriales bacterium]
MLEHRYEILVNRTHRLPEHYRPTALLEPAVPFAAGPRDPKRLLEPKAARAVQALFSHIAEVHGLYLYGISGFRSYERQKELFARNPQSCYVAPPGTSEHQTGLALDVSCPSVGLELVDSFAVTPEGCCLARHAPLYGFILRYPKGKEQITGYQWEPWHIRYVTRPLALYLDATGLTLEEYHALGDSEPCRTTHTNLEQLHASAAAPEPCRTTHTDPEQLHASATAPSASTAPSGVP